jgi:hypothetical protein
MAGHVDPRLRTLEQRTIKPAYGIDDRRSRPPKNGGIDHASGIISESRPASAMGARPD